MSKNELDTENNSRNDSALKVEHSAQYFSRQQVTHANDHVGKIQTNIEKIEKRIDQIILNIKNAKLSVDRISESGSSQVEKVQQTLSEIFQSIAQNFQILLIAQKQENEKL